MSLLGTSKQITASILSIGEELLLGEITDTNASYLSQNLVENGIKVQGIETIGDDLEAVVDAFKRALVRSQLVFATGGLGPTEDDLTIEALAKSVGEELEYFPEIMDHMAALFKRPATSFTESNRKQAWLPKGSIILRNDWGTAPGVHYPLPDGQHVFLMPGVPREMKNIFQERIVSLLKPVAQGQKVVVKKLHTYGMPESQLGERIQDLMERGKNPNVGTRASGGMISVRIVAQAATAEEAEALLKPVVVQVRERLSEILFAEDGVSLAASTLKALGEARKTVALAESCTAGLVASQLADVPGASRALMGGAVVYSNESKMDLCEVNAATLASFGAVSAETARELAQGVRKRFKTDIGLSITGIAGPEGGTELKPVGLVYFGLSTASGTYGLERRFSGLDRNTIRARAGLQALDLLRRSALGLRLP